MFGASSERYKKPEDKKPPEVRKLPWVRKPSERYPNLPFREERIEFSSTPVCDKCGHEMTDSGLTEESEKLTVIPKKYEIVRTIRAKSRCKCQVCLKTAPLPPSIALGSSFTDEMILDVALSKYCDLIPIERYAAMARRGSSIDIPTHSLIELTHYLASFVTPAYQLLKNEIQKARVVHADETPHKMLAGSSTKSWYLWGFFHKKSLLPRGS
jgi:transposase